MRHASCQALQMPFSPRWQHSACESDEPVLYQSTRRTAVMQTRCGSLKPQHLAYRCSCSRSESPGVYNGHCRELEASGARHCVAPQTRCRRLIQFSDGSREIAASGAALGDPIIFRRDQLAAYQLAVVVDDAAQGITHVVRGADLLDSTCWQIAMRQGPWPAIPQYAHLPLVTEPDGSKLAKSRRSLPRRPPECALPPGRSAIAAAAAAIRGADNCPGQRYSRVGCKELAAWKTGWPQGSPSSLITIISIAGTFVLMCCAIEQGAG